MIAEPLPNLTARPYRGLSVQDVDDLSTAALTEWIVGRDVYRRTEFVLARHPERSEHLVTLNTLVRSYVDVLLAGAVSEHERDGRAWKAEWVALPDLCCTVTRATSLAAELLDQLEVWPERMRHNIDAQDGRAFGEQFVRSMAGRLGYSRAYASARSTTGPARGGRPAASDAPDVGDVSMAETIASAVAFTDRWLIRDAT